MPTNAELQAEVDRLRAELDSYKQSEIELLKARLAAALEAADDYKAQALHNAAVGRQIHQQYVESMARMRAEIEAKSTLMGHRGRRGSNVRRRANSR